MNDKGFSLIELLVVIAILGILAIIAIPNYFEYKHATRARMARVQINEIEKAFIACYREREFSPYKESGNWVKPSDCLDDTIQGALETSPEIKVSFKKDSGNSKGCWSVKMEGSSDDKRGVQCIDFKLSERGKKNKHKEDDGTATGLCSATGVCQ